MKNALAIFQMADQMSANLDQIASSGKIAVAQWTRVGQTVDSSFGLAISGTTQMIQSMSDVSSSMEKFQTSTSNIIISTDDWIEVIEEYASTSVQAIDSTQKLAETGSKLEDALNVQMVVADKAAGSLVKYGDIAEDSGKQSEDFVSQLVKAVYGLSKELVEVIVNLIGDIYDAFMKCSEAAIKFELGTAKVAMLADTTQVSMGAMSASIRDMSNETGNAAITLSDTVYQAISAGVDTAQSVEFAGIASKLAAGGFTDAATSVDLLTTAINAYGLESEDATAISDMLIITQNLSKVTVNELSQSISQIIPLASAYNMEMDNLSTAYAVLTQKGTTAAESGTYLKAMLGELGNSASTVATTLQQETGQSFAMLMEQGYSLGDVLDVLGDSVDGDTAKFNALWSSTEAGTGALSLFSSGSETFNGVLEQMQDSASATEKAYTTMANTTAHSQKRMQAAATNLQVTIGSQLNPVLSQLYDAGASAFDWVGEVLEENPMITAAIAAIAVGMGVLGVAFIAFAFVHTPALVLAMSAITASISAISTVVAINPLFFLIVATVAAIAAIQTFTDSLADQEAEYETWTASTKKQHDELEALNAEYEQARTQLGETAPEVLQLRYEMDDLNASFEANKQTVDEFVAECDALVQANSKLIRGYQESIKEIDNQEISTLSLIQKLNDLATATDQSAIAEEQMKSIIAKLNKDLPGLGLSYDNVTSSTETMVEALKKAARAKADQIRFEKSSEAYAEILEKQALAEEQIAKATENVRLEQDKILAQCMDERTFGNGWSADITKYEKELEKAQVSHAEAAAQLAEIEKQWVGIGDEAAKTTNASGNYDRVVANSLGNIKDEVGQLVAKYDQAYTAARNTLDGTVGLFEKVERKAGSSSKSIIEAWQTQIDFFSQYSDNLQQLEQFGIDPELLKKLSDGSAESINQAQSLANELGKLDASGAEETVDKINSTFEGLTAAKSTASITMIGIQTEFDAMLDELHTKLNDSIPKMNMDTEAAEAARKTFSGYIQAIKDSQPEAVSVAQAVADAATAALAIPFITTGKPTPIRSGVGYAIGQKRAEPSVASAKPSVASTAPGVTSTAPGVAFGGRSEPIQFDGGEIVYITDETETIVSSTVYTTDETEKIISSKENSTYRTPLPNNLNMDESPQVTGSSSEKKITLEIAGTGGLAVGSLANQGTILELLIANIKPVLLGIIRREVFEEGKISYEF